MSTPTNQMPQDAESLKNLLKMAWAQLVSHSQTVQELIKANVDLRAALHLAHSDKAAFETYLSQSLNNLQVAPAVAPAVESPATDAPADANTVSA